MARTARLPPTGTAPCPPPPPGCTQAVLGRLEHTERYIDCPGYVVLYRTDWTLGLNDQFIGCVITEQLGTCDPPVLVASTRDDVPELSDDSPVTTRELCQLYEAGCAVTFADASGPGSVVCSE